MSSRVDVDSSLTSVHADRMALIRAAYAVGIGGPLLALAFLLIRAFLQHRYMADGWHLQVAARAVLAGKSPYVYADPLQQAARGGYVYPPLAAVVFAPIAWLPVGVFGALLTLLQIATVFAALRILDVRGRGCYLAALAGGPTAATLLSGNISFLVVLGLALAWRWRRQTLRAAVVIGATIALKMFLWPLVVWLFVTRKVAAGLVSIAVAAVVSTVSWAIVGFSGLTSYPTLLRDVTTEWEWRGYSPGALGLSIGLGHAWASACTSLVVVVLLYVLIRSRRDEQGEQRGFVVAIALALVASPIVWPHYLLVLLVPIALARPRFSPLWMAPVVLWAPMHSDGSVWTIATATVLSGVIFAASIRAFRPLRRSLGLAV